MKIPFPSLDTIKSINFLAKSLSFELLRTHAGIVFIIFLSNILFETFPTAVDLSPNITLTSDFSKSSILLIFLGFSLGTAI